MRIRSITSATPTAMAVVCTAAELRAQAADPPKPPIDVYTLNYLLPIGPPATLKPSKVRFAIDSERGDAKDTGEIRTVRPSESILRFGATDAEVLLSSGEKQEVIVRVNLATGARTEVRRIPPSRVSGLLFSTPPVVSADGTAYAYTTMRLPSDLFLARLRPPR